MPARMKRRRLTEMDPRAVIEEFLGAASRRIQSGEIKVAALASGYEFEFHGNTVQLQIQPQGLNIDGAEVIPVIARSLYFGIKSSCEDAARRQSDAAAAERAERERIQIAERLRRLATRLKKATDAEKHRS